MVIYTSHGASYVAISCSSMYTLPFMTIYAHSCIINIVARQYVGIMLRFGSVRVAGRIQIARREKVGTLIKEVFMQRHARRRITIESEQHAR
jgi:hypothetical protein